MFQGSVSLRKDIFLVKDLNFNGLMADVGGPGHIGHAVVNLTWG